MKNIKIRLFSLLVCFSMILSAQTESQIANEINKRGINSMAEVNAELAKRGMSDADARKMAKVYGIDYDEYINKYISDNENESSNENRFLNYEPVYFDSLAVSELDYTLDVDCLLYTSPSPRDS